jgi:hypothetical protein
MRYGAVLNMVIKRRLSLFLPGIETWSFHPEICYLKVSAASYLSVQILCILLKTLKFLCDGAQVHKKGIQKLHFGSQFTGR